MSKDCLVTIGIAALVIASIRIAGGSNLFETAPKLPRRGVNLESTLAFGRTVPLSLCEIPDLEMIPAVGPSTAQKLYHNREILLQRARSMKLPHLALVTIKGIGPKTAEKIAPWIEMR